MDQKRTSSWLGALVIIAWCSALNAHAQAPKVNVPEATMTFGAHVQRLNAQLSQPWPAIDVKSGEALRWGVDGTTYFEALIELAQQVEMVPGYSHGQLRFRHDVPAVMRSDGPALVVVTPDTLSKGNMRVQLLLEPTTSASSVDVAQLMVGETMLKPRKRGFTLDTPTGVVGVEWSVPDVHGLLGPLNAVFEVDLVTSAVTLSVEAKADATVTKDGITLTLTDHDLVNNRKDGQTSTLRLAVSGAPVLSIGFSDPTVRIRSRSRSRDHLKIRVNKALPPDTHVHVVFGAKVERRSVKVTLEGIDYGAWFQASQ